MKLKKILALMCCAVLLVCISVGATVAYLTSTTKVVENTFTVGQVKITLDEAAVDINGNKIDLNEDEKIDENDRRITNSYKLMPGHDYTKDPTVHVDSTSEEAYLRVKVSVSNTAKADALFQKHGYAEQGITAILTGLDLTKWDVVSNTVAGDVRTYVMQYKSTVNGSTGDVVLFTGVSVPENFTNDDIIELNNTKISIVAEAIQTDGFANVEAAWAAFDAE